MSGAAIRVEGLGKMYRIGGTVERYKTLRESLSRAVAGAGRRVRGWFGGENGSGRQHETIWALKDVSFEVQPGEVVGIIGRNGAGKSTLLKILSRITEPTEGRVEIRGRVGSLLEVGTGFHPELTGRENVYLNGAILGMKRAEVDKKFDEIVAFAEIEKFIDTPVKHYSSGMYVRLAFSVAAHLDTDILLVDEVLSVGDIKFQQKCMGRMQDRAFADKTILFVSHNLPAVGSLCPRTILLGGGRVVLDGATAEVIPLYLGDTGTCASRDLADAPRQSNRVERWRCMRRAAILERGEEKAVFRVGSSWTLRVECEIPDELDGQRMCFGFDIRDMTDRILFGTNTEQYGRSRRVKAGREVFDATIPEHCFGPGNYAVSLYLGDGRRDYEVIPWALRFQVVWLGDENFQDHPRWGVVHLPVVWD